MTKVGLTIDNPVTGDRIVFLQTTEETNGELLSVEYIVTQQENEPHVPLHVHLLSDERFEVKQGTLGVIIGDAKEKRTLTVGEEILIPRNTLHTFWNAGEEDLHFITDITPAGRFQTYWETMFRLARDGKVDKQGFPNLLQLMVLAQIADSYTTDAPIFVLKAVIAILGTVGRWFGYRSQ